ncbi:MAG: hypothetical protein AB2993_01760 [Candidatus Symbiodolus clandestinus]
MSAFTLAAGGNVTGPASQLLQGTVVNILQGLGAQQIKLLAGAGAAAQGQNVIPAALGASGSVVLNNLFESAYGENSQDLTLDERQARRNLVTSIISGTTQALGGDAILANTAAILEMENNYLSQKQEIQKNQELANCPDVVDKTAKEIKWLLVSTGQNSSVVVGVIAGTPVALVEIGCDIAQAVRHPIDTCSGLKKLLGK